jgi:hypothetical protein
MVIFSPQLNALCQDQTQDDPPRSSSEELT